MSETWEGLDSNAIRADFPILGRTVRGGKPLVYLDSAATSQKPTQVLDAERRFYENHNAAAHRGAHALAEEATIEYEQAREQVASFVHAKPSEIIFTKNATEGLNLAAYALVNGSGKAGHGQEVSAKWVMGPGDNVVVTEMEHHSNLVPWQEACAKTGAELRWIRLDDEGRLNLEDLNLIDSRTKAVSVVHHSNILGTINPVRAIMEAASEVGAFKVVDACQSVPHTPVVASELKADLLTWSGHKMLGPSGIGVVWANEETLNEMPVFLTGGSMIETVTMEGSTYAKGPRRFEAGVSMVAQAVSLAEAARYLQRVGMSAVRAHEQELTKYTLKELSQIEGVKIIGPKDGKERAGAISFVVEGVHAHDVGQIMDDEGVAVRVGHHCAWPVCRRYEVPATTRISTYLYNQREEIDTAVAAVKRTIEVFK